MAIAVKFEEQNDEIGKPEDMTDNRCYGLPVCRMITYIPGPVDTEPAEETLAHVSCWQFTPEEVEEIVKTGKAYVKILGVSLYPMSIHGKKPIYTGDGKLCDIVLSQAQIKILKRKAN